MFLALSVLSDINQAGSSCFWICWDALANEEPTISPVLGLQCFLHCKSCQLPRSSAAPGDVFQDDLYLPLAATALHGTDINPAEGESSHDPQLGWRFWL